MLYNRLLEAGIEISNYYSDLLFPATPEAEEILKEFPEIHCERFTNQLTKTTWYCAPFEFVPYWTAKQENR